MTQNTLRFHIAQKNGLEFVFNSGDSLCYPMHTHTSVYTTTLVRRGIVRLRRSRTTDTYSEGCVYSVSPHESHSPCYSNAFDIVSLCVDGRLVRERALSSLLLTVMAYTTQLTDAKLLRPEDAGRLLSGIDEIAILETEGLHSQHTGMDAERHCNMSVFQYIRRCKSGTGLTPHQLQIQNRIRLAKKLLTSSELSLADAALSAGFYDQSHLNRWFNRVLGITPREYRESVSFFESKMPLS